MSSDFPVLGAGALATRLRSEQGIGTWLCVLVPQARHDTALDEIRSAIEAGGTRATLVHLEQQPKNLIDASKTDLVVVDGFDTLSEPEWQHLDLLRSSRLEREEPALLVMTLQDMERLIRLAPNMASFLGGQFFSFQEAAEKLTNAEREARLEQLRAKLSKTDEQVIALASSGTPLDEPAYAEWLVLLGRGDLLRP